MLGRTLLYGRTHAGDLNECPVETRLRTLCIVQRKKEETAQRHHVLRTFLDEMIHEYKNKPLTFALFFVLGRLRAQGRKTT